MVLTLDVVLSALGLAFSVAGYARGVRSRGWKDWYRSIWIPVILLLALLVGLHLLHSRSVARASDGILGLLQRNPGRSIHQIYAEVFPRQRLDIIAESLETLHGRGKIFVETMTFNLPDEQQVTVEVYSLAP